MTRTVMRAAVALALLLGACAPTLVSESLAPPGRSGDLDAEDGFWGVKHYKIELTQGVALAISCYAGGPCTKLTATTDAPAIAEVRPAALARDAVTMSGLRKPSAAVVVIGKTPGVTVLRLRSSDGNRDVQVTVVPAPAVP